MKRSEPLKWNHEIFPGEKIWHSAKRVAVSVEWSLQSQRYRHTNLVRPSVPLSPYLFSSVCVLPPAFSAARSKVPFTCDHDGLQHRTSIHVSCRQPGGEL